MFMNKNRSPRAAAAAAVAVVESEKCQRTKTQKVIKEQEKNEHSKNLIEKFSPPKIIKSRRLLLKRNREIGKYNQLIESTSVLSNILQLKKKESSAIEIKKKQQKQQNFKINQKKSRILKLKNRRSLRRAVEIVENYQSSDNKSVTVSSPINNNKTKLQNISIKSKSNRLLTLNKKNISSVSEKLVTRNSQKIKLLNDNGLSEHSPYNNNNDDKSMMTPSPSKILNQNSVVANSSTAVATTTSSTTTSTSSLNSINSISSTSRKQQQQQQDNSGNCNNNNLNYANDLSQNANNAGTPITTNVTNSPVITTINNSINLTCNGGSPTIQTITSPTKNNNQENTNVSNSNSNSNNNSSNNINSNANNSGVSTNGMKQNYPHSSSTFSLDKNEEFHFIKPPECPVFKPNEEEFKNPLAYIGKIRPFAEKYGIAKIQPPKSWTPPFTVDVDKLKFTPRVQRLNELEAKTRVKLNFLDQIAKFWELQGSSLKIPMVERKALDLYSLHRIVQEEGGIEQTTKERKWSRVAQRMGYPSGKSIGAILKGHYERILHPFDIFTSGKAIDIKLETEIDDQDYKPHGIVSRQQITPPNETTARRSKRFANATQATCGLGTNNTNNHCLPISSITASTTSTSDNKLTYSNINSNESNSTPTTPIKEEIKDEYNSIGYGEYKRMHSYGFGGKMATGGCGRSRKSINPTSSNAYTRRKQKKNDPLAKYICHFCNRGDAEENMLLCDGCDDSYHTFCLMPPLSDIPKGDWRCPKCVVEEVSKPQEAFGFEQAQREYTLQQFGEMADQFKADYFNMAVHLVPTDLVEREFWRIVSSIDEDVTVEYGADLHTMDHGSGFPTKSSLYLLPGDQEYAESSWNLNNLPILEESILGHINADISGMKVPWMYVGMCFATFCWHNEDHWSYSINYLHWGEPKTWYGVPGSKAEAFEETMKSAAPELFHSQPDLLHQLVTIMNPNILMKTNVPVYRTDQHAGEFVITFPRAYHAGFNQGYNFAEAVNFAPADWMKMGRECINHYSMLRRFCVFSHDELVCKMALNPDKLNLGIATACYLDMAEMVDTEKKLRKSLLEWGVTKAEREAFELIPDDERQCDSCKTTCFLSAVTCCCTKAIVCLRHYTELCSCPPDKHTLQYRYTLDELPLMLKKLKVKAETFENWLSKVRDVLDPNTPTTITLEELQNLAQEAEEKKFPSSVILERLNSAVLEAEKCVTVIQQLDINKMRTRTRNSAESAKYKLTMDELDLFVQEIDNLCCIIQEGQSVRDLQILGKDFIEASKHILSKKLNKIVETDLEQLIEEGSLLCIDLPEMERLKCRLEQLKWYKKVREYRDSNEKMSLNDIHNFLKEGLNIVPDVFIEKELLNLQKIVLAIEYWEEVAKKCFESGTQHELPEIEVLLERAQDIEGELPSEPSLRDAVKKAKEWLHNVEVLQSNENYPYFHTLENLVNRGKNIPFHLEELKRMEEHLDSAKSWKDKTAKTFLKKQTQFHLMDVLSPRSEAVMIGSRFKKKLPEEQFTEDMTPQQMVNQFKAAEEKEMSDMRELRKLNMEKKPLEDKYCICKRKFNGNMFNCQLCKDWFHEQCVPPPKNTVRPRPQNATSPPGGNNTPYIPQLNYREKDREVKYLCPSCMRSRRPRLETILQLLVSLQRLPIRLPEGEALQCLTERAMNWQDRARQAFASENVAGAIATLSAISQKFDDNFKNILGKNDEINSTKIQNNNKKKFGGKKCNNNNNNSNGNSNNNGSNNNESNRNKRRYQAKSLMAKNSITSEDDGDMDESSSEEEFRSLKISDNIISSIVNQTKCENSSSPTKIEHAYSVLSPFSNVNISSPTVVTDVCGSPLLKADMPLINLDKVIREKLEDLMMEGDLLEVSLDETQHLWKILNAAKPSISELANIHYKYNLTQQISNDILVINNAGNKKRRSADDSGHIPMKKNTNGKNALFSTLQQSTSQTEPVTKLKRGRKIKKLPKNVLISDNRDQISSGNNSPDIDSALLSASIASNLNNNNANLLQAIVSSTTSIASTAITELVTLATATTITTTAAAAISTAVQLTNVSGNVVNLAGKKRKRATTGNVTTKKAAAAAAAAAAQAQLEQIAAVATTAASTSDDDEECSAPNCARPSGREVDWVQCDGGCNKWFHMFCVGLDKNEIKPDDDYICKRCKKMTHKPNNSNSSSCCSGGNSTNTTNSITSITSTANQLNNAIEGTMGTSLTTIQTIATTSTTTASVLNNVNNNLNINNSNNSINNLIIDRKINENNSDVNDEVNNSVVAQSDVNDDEKDNINVEDNNSVQKQHQSNELKNSNDSGSSSNSSNCSSSIIQIITESDSKNFRQNNKKSSLTTTTAANSSLSTTTNNNNNNINDNNIINNDNINDNNINFNNDNENKNNDNDNNDKNKSNNINSNNNSSNSGSNN